MCLASKVPNILYRRYKLYINYVPIYAIPICTLLLDAHALVTTHITKLFNPHIHIIVMYVRSIQRGKT